MSRKGFLCKKWLRRISGGRGLVVVLQESISCLENIGGYNLFWIVGRIRRIAAASSAQPGLTGFLSTPLFPQILRLKIYFPRYNRSIQFNFYLEQRSVSGSLVLFFSFLVSCPLCTVTFFYILARLQHVLFICGIPQRVCDGWIEKGLRHKKRKHGWPAMTALSNSELQQKLVVCVFSRYWWKWWSWWLRLWMHSNAASITNSGLLQQSRENFQPDEKTGNIFHFWANSWSYFNAGKNV